MGQRRTWLAIAAFAASSWGLSQAAATCPPLAGDAATVVRIGDWALVAGPRLVTCRGGAALTIACGADERLEVRLILASLASGTIHLRFVGDGGALVAPPLASVDGTVVLHGADAERLATQLTAGETLRVRVTAAKGDATPRDLTFATAGLGQALPWLGCGDADACPSRSCDR